MKTTPLFHLGNVPIDVTNLIIGLHLIAGLVLSLTTTSGATTAVSFLAFSSSGLLDFKVWTLFTYPFVHTIDLWMIIGLLFLWVFGRQLEGFLGAKPFGLLYLAITAFSAVAMALLSPLIGDYFLVGQRTIHFAVFISFALVFPNIRMWFDIQTKWIIIAVVTIYMIQHIGTRDWGGLIHLCCAIIAAFAFLHYLGVNSCQNAIAWVSTRVVRKRNRLPKSKKTRKAKTDSKEIDRILDKISESGFDSLTSEEKRTLGDNGSNQSRRKR